MSLTRKHLFWIFLSVTVLLWPAPRTSLRAATVKSSPRNGRIDAFVPNLGQFASQVDFLFRGSGHTAAITRDGIEWSLETRGAHTLRMKLVDARNDVRAAGEEQQALKFNYFVGDRKHWQSDVPSYGAVRAREIYPGIDLFYHANHGAWSTTSSSDAALIRARSNLILKALIKSMSIHSRI
jgi:hypothetical protein